MIFINIDNIVLFEIHSSVKTFEILDSFEVVKLIIQFYKSFDLDLKFSFN